jgi:uncharacterized coiled-coil DUF342 family protein
MLKIDRMEFNMAEEVTTEVIEDTKDWDKEKQRADMEHANFLKAKSQNDKLSDKLNTYESRMSQLESQIKVNQEKVEIAELDPLRADVPDLVNQNQKLIQRLKNVEAQFQQLQSKATTFESIEQERQLKEERQATIDKICKPLDKEYGAKFRSKAVKMAEEAVNNGEEDAPKDAMDAYFMLTRYYKKLKTEDETVKKETIPVDTGSGAFSFQTSEIGDGSLKEVIAQMRKAVGRK